jgi:hypothetical protein
MCFLYLPKSNSNFFLAIWILSKRQMCTPNFKLFGLVAWALEGFLDSSVEWPSDAYLLMQRKIFSKFVVVYITWPLVISFLYVFKLWALVKCVARQTYITNDNKTSWAIHHIVSDKNKFKFIFCRIIVFYSSHFWAVVLQCVEHFSPFC